ncbi:Ferredoxin-type protein NapG (periplasmic nitrate reductase) [Candidatus Sumerlaea chitinivorans]|uniref:Ferredoxin-type protein NapG (Periplasmic nitrate reductase) n=1 Tax=Sumerlaea chitinivorans TaxID=2250252 RepID=A0A2Z4Y8C1_SUMC1|nr:Ferredoxin-type protein NapG (periplasmic nitrate reductase) [Candidatus Sumerlaea chitinivorans]
MRIVIVRRISQVFFLALLVWFCIVANFGTEWWQLRGWPINLILQLDPLVAIGTLLTTHTLYAGLAWALVTIIVTIIFGRIFCGWVCPFGTLHQFFGWLGQLPRNHKQKIEANRFRRAQVIKYYILLVFLGMMLWPWGRDRILQSGLLDPIPFIHRSVNMAVLPAVEMLLGKSLSTAPRQYEGGWVLGALFFATIFANFYIPRFYCRFLCPLGALLGLFARISLFRIAKNARKCTDCTLCEPACEGACDPAGSIRISECLMCFNCLDDACTKKFLEYRIRESDGGEVKLPPDLRRRGVLASLGASLLAVPMMRLNGSVHTNTNPLLVRPPGSLPEPEFLQRCIKCGECMRVCPTNVLMPAGLDRGFEALWTPVLNFRIGTSGCMPNCVACGHVCPTAAIRPLTVEEKRGVGQYAEQGPIRIGTAFVDRSRCLPWALDTPCIVCEEVCPVTPKAIFVREEYQIIREGVFHVETIRGREVILKNAKLPVGRYATGDYFLAPLDQREARLQITNQTTNSLILAGEPAQWGEAQRVAILVRLQRPHVEPNLCIGCGICEHDCPVSGLRAIRVTAENESRNPASALRLAERSLKL